MTAPADTSYMRLALREACKGIGRTSPNPSVGAVVVRDGKVVGRGYHRKAGTPHAEVHALRAAGDAARGATLYVTLEPCNHTGRTPPCTGAILAAGISRVVIGMADPNPRVVGGGARFLAERGLEVVSGVLTAECCRINLPFIKYISTGRPWVMMKAGISLDGRIAAGPGQCTRITGAASRRQVHRLRDTVDAILVGIDTVLVDDPALTTRLPKGVRAPRDPLRVVLDSRLRLPTSAKLLNQDSVAPTWIFCGPGHDPARRKALVAAGAVIKEVPLTGAGGGLDLAAVLDELGRNQCTSLLVEGGGQVHGSFLAAGLVDQVFLFVAPVFLGDTGVPVVRCDAEHWQAALPTLTDIAVRRYGDDVLIEGKIVKTTNDFCEDLKK
ncbi:MAG: riboflavin biosynthesis protein RibD [Deltaproteobacteria bacterium RIFOXYD12_FULL_57_12]|nr:MAG: riboflavin biosynthesis protein RibD [Deltaproteobacteria bacterium RIFOXYD12_FULL_57_12]